MQNKGKISLSKSKQKKKRLTPEEDKQRKSLKIAKDLVLSNLSKNIFDLEEWQIVNAFSNHTIVISNLDIIEKKDWICQYPNNHYFFIKNKTTCNYVAAFISKVYIFDGGYARRVYIRELKSPIYLTEGVKNKFNFKLPIKDIEQMAELIK